MHAAASRLTCPPCRELRRARRLAGAHGLESAPQQPRGTGLEGLGTGPRSPRAAPKAPVSAMSPSSCRTSLRDVFTGAALLPHDLPSWGEGTAPVCAGVWACELAPQCRGPRGGQGVAPMTRDGDNASGNIFVPETLMSKLDETFV